ncbi:unnamed protein product [Triticum turgidum subsp. durum]|uniref:Uncharacterized protein n=1 Tax=Triticum turgidum subsp. durum TaxID=4567 RepID=A0A9R1ASF2_TRITD|nr:unnamed protein product [Triticum turgidum subsp. durum]
MGAVLSKKNRRKSDAVVQEVKVVESCMVAPSEQTPRHGLWLSPLDLVLVNRGHTPTVYFYRSESGGDFFDVARLKAAMAKALVAFYPLAGRLGVGGRDGRAVIDCAGQGALFVAARSELAVDDFSGFKPSPELRRLFVPRVEDYSPPVMCAVQVTFLKCGGVALGTALHHVAADAISAFHFFESKPAPGRMAETELRVISWLGMPVYDADFGWGKPLAMLRAEAERAGFVYLMDGGQGAGSVRVVICTEAAILDDFQRLLYAKF